MKALFFDGQSPSLIFTSKPVPETGEALIRVRYAGICTTDLEILNGYLSFRGIPGHEFVGVVEESPDPGWIGKRVVGEINIGCGTCPVCLAGLERHCPNRRVLGILNKDGAFAEYLTLPVKNLREVPPSISDKEAVFTEPLAAALEILEQTKIEPNFSVTIIGDGKLAQLIARVLINIGVRLTVIGKHPEKLKRFADQGVITFLADEISLPKQDMVIESSGSPTGWELALSLVRPRGTIVLKSTYHKKLTTNPANLVIDEITVVGSRCGQFEPSLRLLESRTIVVDDLISAEFPLENALEALKAAQQRNALKVLLRV